MVIDIAIAFQTRSSNPVGIDASSQLPIAQRSDLVHRLTDCTHKSIEGEAIHHI